MVKVGSETAVGNKETDLSGAVLHDHFRCTFTLTSTVDDAGKSSVKGLKPPE